MNEGFYRERKGRNRSDVERVIHRYVNKERKERERETAKAERRDRRSDERTHGLYGVRIKTNALHFTA